MPEICRFLGIIIAMNYGDHPPPHFHARYGDFKAMIGIAALQLVEGRLPPRGAGARHRVGGDPPVGAARELGSCLRECDTQEHCAAGVGGPKC